MASKYMAQNFDPLISQYSEALIFGNRSLINPDTLNDYSKIGVIHLLAISGLHIGLITGFLYLILGFLKINEITKYLIVGLLILLYAIITGLNPPVVRATIMVELLIISRLFNWEIAAHKIIAIVFLLMILNNPLIIFNISFQLTFLVTVGLLYARRLLISQNYFLTIMKVTLFATFIALPLTINLNYHFNFLTVFANLILVPLITLVVLPLLFFNFCFSVIFNITLLSHFILPLLNLLE